MPCLPSPRRTSRPESVTAERIFLETTSGGSTTSTVPCGVPRVVDILLVRFLQVHHAVAAGGDGRLRQREQLAEPRVEALRDVPGQLQVLALIVSNRDAVGLVEQDVGGLQHRVGEQVGADGIAAGALLLELGHPAQLAHGGNASPAARRRRRGRPRGSARTACSGPGRGLPPAGWRPCPACSRAGPPARRAPRSRAGRRRSRRPRPCPGRRRSGGWRRCSCRGAWCRSAGCPRRRVPWRAIVAHVGTLNAPWQPPSQPGLRPPGGSVPRSSSRTGPTPPRPRWRASG